MIGRGQLGTPDFVQRMDQVAGRTREGLFPDNYWTPGRGESRAARARRLARQVPKVSIAYLLDALDRRLRDLVGLNVRQPSHHAAPFRANQILYNAGAAIGNGTQLSSAAAGGIPLFGPSSGQSTCPDGHNAIVCAVEWFTYTRDQDTVIYPVSGIGGAPVLNVFKNRMLVPGYVGILPGMQVSESVTDAAGADASGVVIPALKSCSPIKLEPGDRIDVESSTNSTGVAVTYFLRMVGYVYPIEVEADGILGTLADRGSGAAPGGGGIAGR